jgi:homoserine O-succinyltransferase
MPVKVPNDLPAVQVLRDENIFVMDESRAAAQDIRPLKIAILNLMPTKEVTETQLLRMIGNTPIQVEVTFLRTASHTPTHVAQSHMEAFYKTFDEIQDQFFDGLIITGAPVEQMAFEEVSYWDELVSIIKWGKHHVFSTLYICWAAQAGLHYIFGVEKLPIDRKCSGVYLHEVLNPKSPIVRGFDDMFYAPHSRHTEVRREDLMRHRDKLEVVAVSPEAGVYLVVSRDGKNVFVTGHCEYDRDTLKLEYERDLKKGMDVPMPCNYFKNDDPKQEPVMRWRSHGALLFQNWLNYYVYQETPYDLTALNLEKER